MLKLYRCDASPLELMPLKMLVTSVPFTWKVLLVARCPFAQMFWLPSPAFVSIPLSSSAFTPGARTASCVKLPVASGVASICVLSSVYPFVVSVAFSNGFAVTVTDSVTFPGCIDAFSVLACISCTSIAG